MCAGGGRTGRLLILGQKAVLRQYYTHHSNHLIMMAQMDWQYNRIGVERLLWDEEFLESDILTLQQPQDELLEASKSESDGQQLSEGLANSSNKDGQQPHDRLAIIDYKNALCPPVGAGNYESC
jgi:hypothetical protein